MRQKVAKQLNKLAKALLLSRGERRKLKRDYQKTPNRNLAELKARIEKVQANIEAKNDTPNS